MSDQLTDEIMIDDVIWALEEILAINPDLIEYIVTYYPPEKILKHLSPDLMEVLNAQLQSVQENSNTK